MFPCNGYMFNLERSGNDCLGILLPKPHSPGLNAKSDCLYWTLHAALNKGLAFILLCAPIIWFYPDIWYLNTGTWIQKLVDVLDISGHLCRLNSFKVSAYCNSKQTQYNIPIPQFTALLIIKYSTIKYAVQSISVCIV